MLATKEELTAFMAQEFPQSPCIINEVDKHYAKVTYPVGETELRPGGTVSGPTMMALADVGLYIAILAEIGIVPLAVTTNLTFNFLRKPAANANIYGECRLLKVGKTQIVGEVGIYSEGQEEMVAHAVGTYAIPPKK